MIEILKTIKNPQNDKILKNPKNSKVLSEIKDDENSNKPYKNETSPIQIANLNEVSSKKRKFAEIETEEKIEMRNYPILEDLFEDVYKNYIKSKIPPSKTNLNISVSEIDSTWQGDFINLMVENIEKSEINDLPRSVSLAGSKLFENEKFWILWIEYHKTSLDLDRLVSVFNQSFNFITTESLIKTYYLKTMREIEEKVLKDYLEEKGIKIECTHNIPVTNQTLFSLLDTYARFLLRSQSKEKVSDSKRGKKLRAHSVLKSEVIANVTISGLRSEENDNKNQKDFLESFSQKKDFHQMDIHNDSKIKSASENPIQDTSVIVKNKKSQGVFENLEVENQENQFEVDFSNKKKSEEIMLKKSDNKINEEKSFITPSKRESYSCTMLEKNTQSVKNNEESNNILPANFTSEINSKKSELQMSEIQDSVDPLHSITQKTENMIVSQATIDKQSDFLRNIHNANNQNQAHFIDLISVDGVNYHKEEANVTNCSLIPNMTQDTIHFVEQNMTCMTMSDFKREEIQSEEKPQAHHHSQEKQNLPIPVILHDIEPGVIQEFEEKDDYVTPLNNMEDNLKLTGESQEDIASRVEEELDVIRELPNSQGDRENEDVNIEKSCISGNQVECSFLLIKDHQKDPLNNSFTHSSKSRSHSRHKNFQSNFTECYPDDLVEGSIINTFNKSYRKIIEEDGNGKSESEECGHKMVNTAKKIQF